MRYVFGFLCVCGLVGTLPQSVSAQDAEEGTTSEPNLQEPAPPSEPAPEEPALQLQLDAAGVEVVPSRHGHSPTDTRRCDFVCGERKSGSASLLLLWLSALPLLLVGGLLLSA